MGRSRTHRQAETGGRDDGTVHEAAAPFVDAADCALCRWSFVPSPPYLVKHVPNALAQDSEVPGRFHLRQVVMGGNVMS